jgi:PTH1 family peptidyl-tRNA hydrolase
MHNTPKEITAIVGLGNPGPRFERTHHNIGFMIVDALADKYHGSWQEKDKMAIAPITIGDKKLLLIKPLTFMNLSGTIFPALQKKGIKAENIIVVHDELEKPFGYVGFRQGGSHRGHNGLRSIIEFIGPDFLRLRFGIGRPAEKVEVNDYVISQFKQDPQAIAQQIATAVQLIEEKVSESA